MKEHHCILSIFGATGDLTNRKLLPALYYLEQEGQINENLRIICIARKEKSHEQYREEASDAIKKFSRIKVREDILKKLISKIYYHRLEFSNAENYEKLRNFIERIANEECQKCERIFYLAVPASFFGVIVYNLKKFKLADRQEKIAYNRVMFEKPFGYDLKSAKELNKVITNVFDEKQIYRIDHYMAKELVQNLIVLRFANSIFEPLWNKKFIDHIQIAVAETLGVEGRGDYYDKAGALRDVMQNHMMQLLTLIAMESPKSFAADDIRKEKIKVLKSISRFTKNDVGKTAVIGQYTVGAIDGKKVVAYSEEPKVNKDSRTETYASLKLHINNNMWRGVPFYLRTGKRLKDRATEIVIVYKNFPSKLFPKLKVSNDMMIIRVQPYEGITLQFNAKVPGNKVMIDNVNMDFCHECKFGPNTPEAYEKLLYDAMLGDQTLFTSWKEVESAWKLIDVVIGGFKNKLPFKYAAGTWGPKEADELIEKDARKWVEPKKPAYADLLGK